MGAGGGHAARRVAGVTERPVLALLAAPGTTSRAVPLLGLLGVHVEVVSWHRRGEVLPDAVLATSVDVLPALATAPPVPAAVWVKHHDQVDRAHEAGATVLLTARAELVPRGRSSCRRSASRSIGGRPCRRSCGPGADSASGWTPGT